MISLAFYCKYFILICIAFRLELFLDHAINNQFNFTPYSTLKLTPKPTLSHIQPQLTRRVKVKVFIRATLKGQEHLGYT